MASKFPPFIANNDKYPRVMYFTPASGATFGPNALVVYNTGTDVIDECGADPTSILGLSCTPASAKTIVANGKVPVYVLDPDVMVGMSSSTTPAESQVMDVFGVEKTGFWRVDISDTTATRVQIAQIDILNGIFYVRFSATNLQLDQILT